MKKFKKGLQSLKGLREKYVAKKVNHGNDDVWNKWYRKRG